MPLCFPYIYMTNIVYPIPHASIYQPDADFVLVHSRTLVKDLVYMVCVVCVVCVWCVYGLYDLCFFGLMGYCTVPVTGISGGFFLGGLLCGVRLQHGV